ncbi:MAG: 2-amino-4-hydroxy-6-hydroxymethyldihydropteridine diphosphokinase [Phycisphaerales bacterium]
MTNDAYIAIGSNLGDRAEHIRAGLHAIAALEKTSIIAVSTVIETDPIGPAGQDPYLNAAAHVRTGLNPRALLDAVLAIESTRGRVRTQEERWGPRTLDLDILLYDNLILDEDGLCIPHPRLHQRPFVLIPLAEIAPDLLLPIHKKTPRALLGVLESHS